MRTLFHFTVPKGHHFARKGDFVQSKIGFLLPQADFPRPKAGFHRGEAAMRPPPDFHVYRFKNARSMKST